MTVERRAINPWRWQEQYGYVQANEVSGIERVLVCSGQTAVDAEGQPQHSGDMRAQVALALDNLDAVLREAGFSWSNLVRLNYYTTDVDAFFQAADVLADRLGGIEVAGTLLGVTRLAFPELLIEIEATAVASDGRFPASPIEAALGPRDSIGACSSRRCQRMRRAEGKEPSGDQLFGVVSRPAAVPRGQQALAVRSKLGTGRVYVQP